jgi:hypothetical protein
MVTGSKNRGHAFATITVYRSLGPDSRDLVGIARLSLASFCEADYLTREVYRIGWLSARVRTHVSAMDSCVVHSLFKEYHTCARSFSLLPLPAPL